MQLMVNVPNPQTPKQYDGAFAFPKSSAAIPGLVDAFTIAVQDLLDSGGRCNSPASPGSAVVKGLTGWAFATAWESGCMFSAGAATSLKLGK